MRRRLAALAAGALLLPAASEAAPPKPDPDPPERLLVTAREYGLSLSKTKLRAGDAIVELYDYGEDPHDLRIQRAGGATIHSVPRGASGRDRASGAAAQEALPVPALVLAGEPRRARHVREPAHRAALAAEQGRELLGRPDRRLAGEALADVGGRGAVEGRPVGEQRPARSRPPRPPR